MRSMHKGEYEAYIDGLLAGIIAGTRGAKCAAQAVVDVFSDENPQYFYGFENAIYKHELFERLPTWENDRGEMVHRYPDGSLYISTTGEVIEPET